MKRNLLPEFVNQSAGSNAPKDFNETNDCVVRAISNAFRIDYALAHALCKAHGREDRKGMQTHPFHECLNMSPVAFAKGRMLFDVIIYSGTFQETYIVDTFTHWLCIRNGEILDWTHRVNEKVWRVWKINESPIDKA